VAHEGDEEGPLGGKTLEPGPAVREELLVHLKKVPRGFREGSERVPRGFREGSKKVPKRGGGAQSAQCAVGRVGAVRAGRRAGGRVGRRAGRRTGGRANGQAGRREEGYAKFSYCDRVTDPQGRSDPQLFGCTTQFKLNFKVALQGAHCTCVR
jgi:hypothetical protein